ncbi:MAG: amidase [Armatimonadetes bacterium]|nr:amidase [Armatimonadota bacterium]
MPAMPLDAFAPATEMLRALRAREVSAVGLLELHLRRIRRYNLALNAIVSPDFEAARRTAAEADAARGQGQDSPLLGLPLTIKDCIYVKGLPATGGIPDRAAALAEDDARLVARVKEAGGVIMGKTNVSEMAADFQATNPLFGRTGNPWDLSRTPGGSTGGAAALAAGLTPLEFGGDFGGSIRCPAAFCGVFGHKSSETAVRGTGHFPASSLPNQAFVMPVLGPLARSAEDLEVAFDVIAGPEVGEDVAWRLEMPPPRQRRLADFRVAVLSPVPWAPVDADIAEALDDLAGALGRLGARVRQAQPEAFGDLRDHIALFFAMVAAETSAGLSEEECHTRAEGLRARGDPYSAASARGLVARAGEFVAWHGEREAYRASYRAFFRDWDVILAPVMPVAAFPHNDAPWPERTITVNGETLPYRVLWAYTTLANLSGQPATAFPVGLTRNGLPIGLQAIGPYLEDRTPMRFAALVAQEFGGFRRPMGYDAD